MHPFSKDVAWVHADDLEEPLYMHLLMVLRLAVVYYYGDHTFSYVPLPVHAHESQLIDYGLIFIANTDIVEVELSATPPFSITRREMVQLAATENGRDFLEMVPLAALIIGLIANKKSPLSVDRTWRHYPYSVPRDDPNRVALHFMGGLTVPELPQFLSHKLGPIRAKALELLNLSGGGSKSG